MAGLSCSTVASDLRQCDCTDFKSHLEILSPLHRGLFLWFGDGYEVWRSSQPHGSCDEMVAWAGSIRLGEWNLTVASMGHIPRSKLISRRCFRVEGNHWHPLEVHDPLKNVIVVQFSCFYTCSSCLELPRPKAARTNFSCFYLMVDELSSPSAMADNFFFLNCAFSSLL